MVKIKSFKGKKASGERSRIASKFPIKHDKDIYMVRMRYGKEYYLVTEGELQKIESGEVTLTKKDYENLKGREETLAIELASSTKGSYQKFKNRGVINAHI